MTDAPSESDFDVLRITDLINAPPPRVYRETASAPQGRAVCAVMAPFEPVLRAIRASGLAPSLIATVEEAIQKDMTLALALAPSHA